jgi:DNA-binding MarR family transcriptional regulator
MSRKPKLLDSETKALESPNEHKDEVRLWLRLLTCTTLIEGEIRKRLADEFGTTLPRFDLFAQLESTPSGMTLGDLSRRMMVTNGNVTGLVERLVESGHIERASPPNDRRVQIVKLTPKGRASYARMAKAHENWIVEIFGQTSQKDIKELLRRLKQLKDSVGSLGAEI